MDILITRNGEQHGPYPEATARQMLEAGQLLPTDLAWHDGAAGWNPLSEVLGAATQPPPTPPAGGIPKRTMAGAAPAEGKPEDSEAGDPDKISVTRKGEPIGPYSREKAKEYFASGQLLSTDWGWHDGMDDWKPLNEVLDMQAPTDAGVVVSNTGTIGTGGTRLQGEPESRSQNRVDFYGENTTRLLRKALFSNPWGAIKGFFKDLKEYYRTIFKQIRHPEFSVKEGQGIYFGDIDLVKMSVSLYVTIVLIGLAIVELELSGGSARGNVEVALLNVLGILVFFVSIWCAVWIGRVWAKWAKTSFSRRQIDKIFVYESCVVFAMVLPLILTVNLTVMGVCFGLAILHPIYMFLRINKVQATNILVRFCFGVVLATGFSSSFVFQYVIGQITAGNQVEESINEPILAENIVGTYENSAIRIKFLENGTTETYNDDTKSAEGEWKVDGSEVLVLDSSGGQETIVVFRVKLNGDLIYSASIDDEGRRDEIPIDEQFIIEKIE